MEMIPFPTEPELCPLCEEGDLHEQMDKEDYTYKGKTIKLPCLYSICDHCGSELADAEQVRKNKAFTVCYKTLVDHKQLCDDRGYTTVSHGHEV